MHRYRKVIKDDLEQRRRGLIKCVRTPDVSSISPAVPYMTPASRFSPATATPSTVSSRNASTMKPSAVKSQSSLPVCGDSFFDNSELDESHSNWSFAKAASEFSSFDVSNMQPHNTPSVLSSSNVIRSSEVSPSPSVHRSPLSPVQCQTSQSADIRDMWLTSRQLNKTSVVNSLPASDVKQSPSSSSVPAGSPPSGFTCTLLSYV